VFSSKKKEWIDEARFFKRVELLYASSWTRSYAACNVCGWKFHGTRGGLAAGLLFVFPGAMVVLALAAIYAAFGNVPVISALFLGIKSAVIVIMVEALLRIARRALKGAEYWLVAAASFAAIFFISVPFPLVVLIAAMVCRTSCFQSKSRAHRISRTAHRADDIDDCFLLAANVVDAADRTRRSLRPSAHFISTRAVFFRSLP
jgi:chromate transporter